MLLTINKINCHKSNYTTSISTVCVYIHVYNLVSYGMISCRGSENSGSRATRRDFQKASAMTLGFMVKVQNVQQTFLKFFFFFKLKNSFIIMKTQSSLILFIIVGRTARMETFCLEYFLHLQESCSEL